MIVIYFNSNFNVSPLLVNESESMIVFSIYFGASISVKVKSKIRKQVWLAVTP